MAPRTRANRAANLEKDKILARAGVLNREGFLALPVEIHLEIVSHFPVMTIPTSVTPVPTDKLKKEDVDRLRARHLTLLSLSQTCRALRHIFLGQLWQRIEVFDGMQTPKGFLPKTSERLGMRTNSMRLKMYAEELIRQLEIVTIRESGLAQHVEVVNVIISHYSAASVFSEVAKAFALFPNLHTVQLNVVATLADSIAFLNQEYPQIRVLSLSPSAFPFADFCPGARLIVPYMGRYFFGLPYNCPNLEVLGTTCLSQGKQDVSHLNNLQDISLMCDTTHSTLSELFEPLRSLPRLHTIQLRIDLENIYWYWTKSGESDVDKRIESARAVLAGKEGDKSSKKIIVTHKGGRVETLGV